MTTLAPLPVQSFKDSNGNPLAGGLLYTYAAGTSTPQTTYQDVTTTSPNANPIVLNSRGEAQIWLNPAQTYKLVLYDSFSTLIWSVDQVSNAASITSGSIQTQTYTAVTTTGTSTAYVIATNPIQATLVAGQRYRISLHTPNGIAPTLVRDGLAAVTFKVYNAAGAKVSPPAGTLPALFDSEYDGADYVVFNQLPSSASTPTIQTFTVSGTYTAPAGLRMAIFEVVGGGGGGSGAAAGDRGNGGGGGGYSKKFVLAATIGATQTVTIGGGGAGGAAGTNAGVAGTTTSVGALLSATSGGGGITGGGVIGNGISGGTGTGGILNLAGGFGSNSLNLQGGAGGSSIYGQGAGQVLGSAGGPGNLYGGGGGGADGSGATARAGGAGAAGVVIVTEFY